MMACGGVWSSLEEGRPGGVQKEIPIRPSPVSRKSFTVRVALADW